MPVTDREHADLQARVDRHDERFERDQNRFDRDEDRVDRLESRMDRYEGMASMLKIILGTSVLGTVAGLIALWQLIGHVR